MQVEALQKNKSQILEEIRDLTIEKCRRSFWTFCKTIAPDFYKEDRKHLKTLCDILQDLYEHKLLKDNGEPYTRLMINMPPRFGKSRTLILFCEWCLGISTRNRIITCSYNDDLATDFSRYTRDGINDIKTYPHEIIYSDIFPKSKIKDGNASYHQWALEGEFFNYKGAGIGGTITGKGCNISIVDDPVKDAETAFNEEALNKIWRWYTGTFLSRLEGNGIQIINMTRWSKNDICGRILDGEEAGEWYILKMEAMNEETGKLLSDEILDSNKYKSLKTNMDLSIFRANYHQEPIDIQGRLYQVFKTYTTLPEHFERIMAYVDTADTGDDCLCCIIAGIYQGEAWVLDVYFSKDGMEITEPRAAQKLVVNNVNIAHIESNNGGRGFARNVEKILWEKYNTRKPSIKWFHQKNNKQARILSNSTFVMDHIYFPHNWKDRFPEYYKAMNEYQREGKNKHDDAPDATTGLGELISRGKVIVFDRNLLAL
ncbi:terminase [Clostridium botulinum]|uniref:Terminase n=1 Tax=Clostridium botulinum TaxID=1491 RepID=A0A6M0SNW0_CLOBO|nr:terminase [Clostridium botulinum]